MYLHKFPAPKIYEYDTLTSEEKWNEFYDIILANPPYMSPKGGIKPHKKFSIQAKRSEVLFVDYITEHLNPNGRGGVIVPEGIIFQSGIAYKKLRKMLIENSLYAVISLPAGVFNPYSGVKTSILFLDKNLSKKTDKILFVKVNHDGFGLGAQRRKIIENDLPMALEIIKKYKQSVIESKEIELGTSEKKLAHVVKKEKIAESGDYNLSGYRYKEVVVYNGKWDFVEVQNAIKTVKYTTKIKKEKFQNKGKYPIIDQSEKFIAGYWNQKDDVFRISKPVVIFGDHTKCFKYINFDFVLGADGVKILEPFDEYIPKFFYFILKNIKIKDLGYSRHFKELKRIKIPLPPLGIQEQIIAELDSYQKIIDGAKQVVENYKPTFKIDPEWEIIELDEICKLEYGYSEPAKNNGEYRYIRITDISEEGLLKYDEIKYVDLNEKSKKYILKKGDVLVARTGATYGKTLYYDEGIKAIFAGYLIRLNFREEKINSKFYWIFSQSPNYRKQKNELVQGGGQPQFNANVIKHIKVPLPSLEIQEKIVFKTEKVQKIINANKELITIFENKIKDKIVDVWGE
jgi:type I restriction enzyme M protein